MSEIISVADRSDVPAIVEHAAALASAAGGVVRVRHAGEERLAALADAIRAHTDPPLEVTIADGLVVHAADGPVFAYGRPVHREDQRTVHTPRDVLLARLRGGVDFERRADPDLVGARLDHRALRRFCARTRLPPRQALDPSRPEQVLASLGFGTPSRPNVGGTLLFAADPQRGLPQAVIAVRGERGQDLEHQWIDGTLLEQIEVAVAFVDRRLRRGELHPDAVREAIVNAVAHRDYRDAAPIRVSLDDERLEVWSPGAALGGPDEPRARNPLIARALSLADLVRADGLRFVRDVVPGATFASDERSFRVTLPLPGALNAGLPPRLVAFLGPIAVGEAFRAAEYAAAAQISLRTAHADLAALEGRGRLARIGGGRGTRWVRR